VSAASVSRWRKRQRDQGDLKPKALGGDRRSGRIEAHRATILAMLKETTDITLEELRRQLAEKGLLFGDGSRTRARPSAMARSDASSPVTPSRAKKRPDTRPNRTAPTS
jgi:hypothetical protein